MVYEFQRAQFANFGYAIFEGVLEGDLLATLREQCGAFIAREDARMDAAGSDQLGLNQRGKRYFANECQREQPALRSVLFSTVMAEICRATLGDNAYFFLDQYVVKGPEGGTAFSWHQDSGYVVGNGGPIDHAPYLTCWCTLDDVTVQNGTVSILPFTEVPQSRDWILPHIRDPKTNDLVGWDQPGDGMALEVPAGSVVAFSSRLLHASGPNLTPDLRRIYLAQYTPEVMLNPGTRHLRRNAVPFLLNGKHITHG
ncbi:MAG: phytanoyl-CoA dioxygenase [Alphaproteobacteria bacterium PA2]|nr:MAG: phytanoyl-CoA dioxygenase [Alphaproteobacteria bacterium PA2]